MDGQGAGDHLDRMDELKRRSPQMYLNHMSELETRSRELALLDAYGAKLGVPITGLDFRPGTP